MSDGSSSRSAICNIRREAGFFACILVEQWSILWQWYLWFDKNCFIFLSNSIFPFRCSFHSYADFTYAKHLESGGVGTAAQSIYGTLGGPTPLPSSTPTPGGQAAMMMRAETPGGGRGDGGVGGGGGGRGTEYQQSVIEVSEDSINSIEKVEEWNRTGATNSGNNSSRHLPNGTSSPRENGKNYSGRKYRGIP